jgi:hypothetical protein
MITQTTPLARFYRPATSPASAVLFILWRRPEASHLPRCPFATTQSYAAALQDSSTLSNNSTWTTLSTRSIPSTPSINLSLRPCAIQPLHEKSMVDAAVQEHILFCVLEHTPVPTAIYNANQARICALELPATVHTHKLINAKDRLNPTKPKSFESQLAAPDSRICAYEYQHFEAHDERFCIASGIDRKRKNA